MATFTYIDHIQITIDYTPAEEPTGGCTPYLECAKSNESWESLFKRLIVVQDDGTLAIRTCCEDSTPEEEEPEEEEPLN